MTADERVSLPILRNYKIPAQRYLFVCLSVNTGVGLLMKMSLLPPQCGREEEGEEGREGFPYFHSFALLVLIIEGIFSSGYGAASVKNCYLQQSIKTNAIKTRNSNNQ